MLLFVKWAFWNNLAAFLDCCVNSLCMFGFFFVDVFWQVALLGLVVAKSNLLKKVCVSEKLQDIY